jgi:hypothetical protein
MLTSEERNMRAPVPLVGRLYRRIVSLEEEIKELDKAIFQYSEYGEGAPWERGELKAKEEELEFLKGLPTT